MEKKNLLILCAQSDPCDEELKLIEAVGNLLGMNICKTTLKKEDDLKKTLCGKNDELWDYVYLATHADIYGFGDADPDGLNPGANILVRIGFAPALTTHPVRHPAES